MGRRALVMSGGGARGAFEAGAAEYLIEHGKDFDVIAGVSVGALNAAMLGQGKGVDGLKWQAKALTDLWLGITGNDDFYRNGLTRKVRALWDRTGIFDPSPTRTKLEECISPEALAGSGREVRIGAVELESGNYVVANQRTPNIREWILASASMPVAFPPVLLGSQHVADGGIRNITPLREAFKALNDLASGDQAGPADADEIYVVLASPLTLPPPEHPIKNGIGVAGRALEIMIDEVYREDILYAIAINRSVRACAELEKKLAALNLPPDAIAYALKPFPYRPPDYRLVKMFGIAPPKAYMGYMDLSPAKIREALEAGRLSAQAPLDEKALERLLQR